MRLERLEICGFKSFSDRSELSFDKGVTAIVGPNGCGKSNVADAITWVMGEQSAKSLRGERMEDVIFNGSDARKPTAAAEVRLRFSGVVKRVTGPAFHEDGRVADGHGLQGSTGSNGHGDPAGGNGSLAGAGASDAPSDGLGATSGAGEAPENGAVSRSGGPSNGNGAGSASENGDTLIQSVAREVEVTRRLYRSGDSEYLIDGRVCRLRDVHDLLMDTGLGAKAYAIIEQGKIGMILGSRPADRRQLIEEAAGVTKYKSRRRAAELKLEAARQNLTRIDDIVFEVEKQRGALKRQAAKARRYQKLRAELRRWEKVLCARKYRQLSGTIESARARLAEARERESLAAARVAEIEADLGRRRIELVEAESRATACRERAHAAELAINRLQQQLEFDRDQLRALEARRDAVEEERRTLEARREPARLVLESRRSALEAAAAERERAGRLLAEASEQYAAAHQAIEGLEADVEAARSEVFSALNSATALRHALEHAAAARDRAAEVLTKLDVELQDVRIEAERVQAERAAAADRLREVHEAMEATRIARSARESELASARIEHDWRAQALRARERELAGLQARLASLSELEAARAGYGDGPRAVLAQANGAIGQQGAVADYIDVEPGYERAVEACLGDLLQHVIVERAEQADAGLQLLRAENAGRCGFLIASEAGSAAPPRGPEPPPGVVPLSAVLRVGGPFAAAITRAIGEAWIAGDVEAARRASRAASIAVATPAGDVFRGPALVAGGSGEHARGILETKREIRELGARIEAERQEIARLAGEIAQFDAAIAQASSAVAALSAEQHRQEKAAVAHEAQIQRADDEAARLVQKGEQLARERAQAVAEREALDRRQDEARQAIVRLEQEQRAADERFAAAQHRLFGAREAAEDLNRRAAEAGAAHAALVERAAALEAEVRRLEESAAEQRERSATLDAELDDLRGQIGRLAASTAAAAAQVDTDVAGLDALHAEVRAADEALVALRARADEQEALVKEARTALDAARAVVSGLDVARATAESDLAHLAASCLETLQAPLEDVVAEVDRFESAGETVPDAGAIEADEPEDDAADQAVPAASEPETLRAEPSVAEAAQRTMSAEEAIAALKARIDRLGPVNMMAIEQFDELEARHAFLTTQRTDLVESIAQTTEAIRRIDQTTRQRFSEAFEAINRNFQETFSTLFGGGRAGLTLIDENDPLESGIDIVAQPPGKRLQSVQLLSGGEKAMTAIALMFALFKYKPSPFCLLDEIDAPLDDANIGRFVEMLRGMQAHTQFILITHNRKTMEIADRLYGVTMEEPGVSKLISISLN